MELSVFEYQHLLNPSEQTRQAIKRVLCDYGIIGIKGVPNYLETCQAYVDVARKFSKLDESIKLQYAPQRELQQYEGYEIGVEKFKNDQGQWVVDDKKASFYAFVPDLPENPWPKEVDLKTAYLNLGLMIFETGKLLLHGLNLDEQVGIDTSKLQGYGRMLHYRKEQDYGEFNPDWCGGHYDHSLFTGLMPAYYFKDGNEINEPEESGLFIIPTNGKDYVKIDAQDKDVMLFQVGEFGQLASNDAVRATKHIVKRAHGAIERFTLAIFYNPDPDCVIYSSSVLTQDFRFKEAKEKDDRIQFKNWNQASLNLYDAS